MIGGVCAGLAQHFGWDIALVRILLVVLVFFGCGTPILAYFIAWIVIPNEPFVPVPPYAQTYAQPATQPAAPTSGPTA
jgi:phage shock protein C